MGYSRSRFFSVATVACTGRMVDKPSPLMTPSLLCFATHTRNPNWFAKKIFILIEKKLAFSQLGGSWNLKSKARRLSRRSFRHLYVTTIPGSELSLVDLLLPLLPPLVTFPSHLLVPLRDLQTDNNMSEKPVHQHRSLNLTSKRQPSAEAGTGKAL